MDNGYYWTAMLSKNSRSPWSIATFPIFDLCHKKMSEVLLRRLDKFDHIMLEYNNAAV